MLKYLAFFQRNLDSDVLLEESDSEGGGGSDYIPEESDEEETDEEETGEIEHESGDESREDVDVKNRTTKSQNAYKPHPIEKKPSYNQNGIATSPLNTEFSSGHTEELTSIEETCSGNTSGKIGEYWKLQYT